LQDPPKFTQIRIFGLKSNHVATLNSAGRKVFSPMQNILNVVSLELSAAKDFRKPDGNILNCSNRKRKGY
jgi:hypothetical protein